jgi:hypothetical protein
MGDDVDWRSLYQRAEDRRYAAEEAVRLLELLERETEMKKTNGDVETSSYVQGNPCTIAQLSVLFLKLRSLHMEGAEGVAHDLANVISVRLSRVLQLAEQIKDAEDVFESAREIATTMLEQSEGAEALLTFGFIGDGRISAAVNHSPPRRVVVQNEKRSSESLSLRKLRSLAKLAQAGDDEAEAMLVSLLANEAGG